MPDQLAQGRWIEIQFYYICSDILNLRNNIMDVMDIIDSLAFVGNYNAEQTKQLANEILSTIRFKPTREEFCLISREFGVPINSIKARTGIHNKTLYEMFEKNKQDPRFFYPKLTEHKVQVAEQFVIIFNNFKKVGLI